MKNRSQIQRTEKVIGIQKQVFVPLQLLLLVGIVHPLQVDGHFAHTHQALLGQLVDRLRYHRRVME